MSTASNIYAEKIYSEHPVALWALDEDCNFVSYINDEMYDWTKSGQTFTSTSVSYSTKNSPIKNSTISYFPANSTTTLTLKSSAFNVVDVNSFTTSFYFLQVSEKINKVEIAYTTDDGTTLIGVTEFTSTANNWTQFSKTFFTSTNLTSVKIVVKIYFNATGSTSKDFYTNGFSVSSSSEEFTSESIGISLQEITGTSLSGTVFGKKAYAYGSDVNFGWYMGDNTSKALYAKNYGMPLVYGASNITTITKNPNGPSLIVPGYGFMNKSGQNKVLALECWLRINSVAVDTPRKIVGPISSDDGIYVYGPHLIARIGNYTLSHYVGEWMRPMLVQLELDNEIATLLLNGEVVSTGKYDTSLFPDKLTLGEDNDYIAFYAYDDIESIDIDCVAIYPYKISNIIALRRFAYGQAAKLPENIATAYGGTQIDIAYEKAGYQNVKTYPGWNLASYKENISTEKSVLSSPQFDLPRIVLSETFGKNEEDLSVWKSDLQTANGSDTDGFIKIRPNDSRWNVSQKAVHGYMLLESLSLFGASENTAGIYGVFQTSSLSEREQILFKLEDKDNKDCVFVSVVSNGTTFDVKYLYKISSKYGSFSTSQTIAANTKFSIALKFETLKNSSVYEVENFFNNLNSLQLYIGGDYSGTDDEVSTTFDGKIITFGVCTTDNLDTLGSIFNTDGRLSNITSNNSNLISHSASYKVQNKPIQFGDTKIYNIDISTKSLFTDYINTVPLSKTILKDGSKIYDLDFIQFNLDSMIPPISSGTYDISKSLIKSYISFQYTNNIKIYPASLTSVSLQENNVIVPDSSWNGKKYEVLDGSIIYMPTNFESGKTIKDVSVVVYLEVISERSIANPVKIRYMKITPVSLSSESKNYIGTKNGIQIYPESNESEKPYDGYAPYSINNSSYSYLYLTNKTGIKLLEPLATDKNNKITFPINQNSNGEDSYINTFSFVSMFNDNQIPTGKTKIFEFTSQEGFYSVYITRLDYGSGDTISNRGKLSIEKSNNGITYSVDTNSVFYINGILSNNPVINVKQWNLVSILFKIPVKFENNFLSLTGTMLLNNFSYYKVDPSFLNAQIVTKTWTDIQSDYNDWDEVNDLVWKDVLVTSKIIPPKFGPKIVYSLYTGTNKVFATVEEDTSGIWLKDYKYSAYKGGTWQQIVLPAI